CRIVVNEVGSKSQQIVSEYEAAVAVTPRFESSMTAKTNCPIVTLLGSYIPGYKGGGPIRSVASIVAALGAEFRFKILTLNRTLGDTLPYPGAVRVRWVRVGNADVMYLSSGWEVLFRLTALLRALDTGSVLYLNSFF